MVPTVLLDQTVAKEVKDPRGAPRRRIGRDTPLGLPSPVARDLPELWAPLEVMVEQALVLRQPPWTWARSPGPSASRSEVVLAGLAAEVATAVKVVRVVLRTVVLTRAMVAAAVPAAGVGMGATAATEPMS